MTAKTQFWLKNVLSVRFRTAGLQTPCTCQFQHGASGAAVAADAHCAGATGEHGLNTEAGPLADAVTVLIEVVVPAIIDGEQEFDGARDVHGAEYKMRLMACKASERRSRDARPIGALRSLPISGSRDSLFLLQ